MPRSVNSALGKLEAHHNPPDDADLPQDRLANLPPVYLVVRINKPLSCLYQHGPPPGQLTNYVPEMILFIEKNLLEPLYSSGVYLSLLPVYQPKHSPPPLSIQTSIVHFQIPTISKSHRIEICRPAAHSKSQLQVQLPTPLLPLTRPALLFCYNFKTKITQSLNTIADSSNRPHPTSRKSSERGEGAGNMNMGVEVVDGAPGADVQQW
jgi:hypothetical protein